MKKAKTKYDLIERWAIKATRWIGSTSSILVHTALFFFAFLLYFWGISITQILLIVTTLVSLEAIYLAIFIQMTVNRQSRRLREVSRDIDEIQEDIDEIQEDIDEIQEDVEDIEEDDEEERKRDEIHMKKIETIMTLLMKEVEGLKNNKSTTKNP